MNKPWAVELLHPRHDHDVALVQAAVERRRARSPRRARRRRRVITSADVSRQGSSRSVDRSEVRVTMRPLSEDRVVDETDRVEPVLRVAVEEDGQLGAMSSPPTMTVGCATIRRRRPIRMMWLVTIRPAITAIMPISALARNTVMAISSCRMAKHGRPRSRRHEQAAEDDRQLVEHAHVQTGRGSGRRPSGAVARAPPWRGRPCSSRVSRSPGCTEREHVDREHEHPGLELGHRADADEGSHLRRRRFCTDVSDRHWYIVAGRRHRHTQRRGVGLRCVRLLVLRRPLYPRAEQLAPLDTQSPSVESVPNKSLTVNPPLPIRGPSDHTGRPAPPVGLCRSGVLTRHNTDGCCGAHLGGRSNAVPRSGE